MKTRSKILSRNLAALCLLSFCLARITQAQHPTHPEGFSPEKAYESGLVDSVDLFSGALSLRIPIGPLTLTYSSNVWTYEGTSEGKIKASPNRKMNAGLGWRLSFGEVYHRSHWYNDTGRWLYVDESGGKHVFKSDLHKGEDDGDPAVYYSRDNTYLRLTEINVNNVELEFPNGTTQRFHKPAGGEHNLLRFAAQWDRFGSLSDPDLEVTYAYDPDTWTVTDRHGRTHYLHFGYGSPTLDDALTSVDFESYQGQRAVYAFSYQTTSVHRSCKDDDPGSSTTVQVPFLRQIDLPQGTSYLMKEGSTLHYDTQCHGQLDEAPGTILGMVLPTGGKFAWDYRLYTYPDPDPIWSDNTGVKSKTMKAADDTVLGVWTYRNDSDSPQGDQPEVRTHVIYPTGDCVKHHFNARWWLSNGPKRGWELGLPFAYSEEDNGFYLSQEIWDSSSGESCAGTKLRSIYSRYEHDELPVGTGEPEWWINSNRRLVGTRQIFHDDGDRWLQIEGSQFDGLGHFRELETTGNFWDGTANNEKRVRVTNFNRTTGTYPGNYVPVSTSEPWILHVFDHREATEPDAVGQASSREEFHFDDSTGALSCRRVLASGVSRGVADLLTTYSRDTRGLVTEVKRYGGDLHPISTAGSECGEVPAEPEYWSAHTYEIDVLETSRWNHPDGTPGLFPSYDVDLDPSTGLVIASRDPAGRVTSYAYDHLGRLTSVSPPDRAEMVFGYINASGTSGPSVATQRISGTQVLAEGERHFDDFGRLSSARLRMPDGSWSERVIELNARGWRTSVSQFGDPTKTTQFLDYDPFGRFSTLRPPEGPSHDLKFSYQGARRGTVEAKLTLSSGEAYVPRSFEWDLYGRSRLVEEDSDTGGQTLSTFYHYDVGSRLTRLEMGPAISGVTQARLYSYDNRGFLLAETHPEKGAAGNGSTSYSDYDSLGRLGRRVDGPNDIGYSYNWLGRLLQVRDRGSANRLLIDNLYDTTDGNALGKLRLTRRYNWVDLPWRSGGEESVGVRRIYAYDAAGAPTTVTTNVAFQGEALKRFVYHQQYDELGNVNRIEYPYCDQAACRATVGSGLMVDTIYDQGLLEEVVDWTDPVAYHPSGAFKAIPHTNGVTDLLTLDPNRTLRIGRLCSVPGTGDCDSGAQWDSGSYVYGGAGEIAQIGPNSFFYDRAGRLLEGSVSNWKQEYSYDAFANLLSETTTDPFGSQTVVNHSVDDTTNRLNTPGASYDAAGNTTSWAGTVYGYDALDRTVAQDDRWIHLYDSSGERTATIDWTASVATREITYSIRGGARLLSRFQQIGEDEAGNWSREREFVYAGPRLLASRGADTRHYHLDHLGTPRLITDSGGATVSTHDYLPYGEEVTNPGDEPLKFTGHERDPETGLDYMHARYYTSSLARFLRVDPSRGVLGLPQSLNRYAYVRGNPLRYADPDGRNPAAAVTLGLGAGAIGSGLQLSGDYAEEKGWDEAAAWLRSAGGALSAFGGGVLTLGSGGVLAPLAGALTGVQGVVAVDKNLPVAIEVTFGDAEPDPNHEPDPTSSGDVPRDDEGNPEVSFGNLCARGGACESPGLEVDRGPELNDPEVSKDPDGPDNDPSPGGGEGPESPNGVNPGSQCTVFCGYPDNPWYPGPDRGRTSVCVGGGSWEVCEQQDYGLDY